MFKIDLTISDRKGIRALSPRTMKVIEEFETEGYIRKLNGHHYLLHVEGKKENVNAFINWCNNNQLGFSIQEMKLSSSSVKPAFA